MLQFLLWLNNKIISHYIHSNQKIQLKMEYKKLKNLIKNKWENTEIIKCKDGIVIVIKDSELDLELKEWVRKNIMDEEYNNLKQKEIDILKSESLSEENINYLEPIVCSEGDYKLTNVKLALETTEGIKYIQTKNDEDTLNFLKKELKQDDMEQILKENVKEILEDNENESLTKMSISNGIQSKVYQGKQ